MKTVIILVLGLIVGTTSFAKSDTEVSSTSAVQSRVTVRDGNIELAIEKKDANASIEFLDESGYVLYKFKYNIRKGICQRFDVSQLIPGTYKIIIECQKEKIIKEFTIEATRENQTVLVKG